MKLITLSFDTSIRHYLNVIVCKILGHLSPHPKSEGSEYCYRCHSYLGEVGHLYKYKITALNEKGETIQSPVSPLNHPVETIVEGQK